MDSKINDCYFYYYSSCTKGDMCTFRHEPAALGTEMMCDAWKQGRCYNYSCKFRHMEIQVNRSQIPCYWESQPGGCRKPHCVFRHQSKEGNYASNQPTSIPHQESILGRSQSNSSISAPTPPQPVKEYSQPVETPRAQQVLINPFDEESDQESLKGTPVKNTRVSVKDRLKDVKSLHSTVKPPSAETKPSVVSTAEETSTNFGIKSLSEIRRGKQKTRILDDEDVEMTCVESTPSGDSFGIKSLEQIRREKALESMKRRRHTPTELEVSKRSDEDDLRKKLPPQKQFAEQPPLLQKQELLDERHSILNEESAGDDRHYVIAEEDFQENTDPIPSGDGTRRIIISAENEDDPPAIVQPSRLQPQRPSLKERLGQKRSVPNTEASESSAAKRPAIVEKVPDDNLKTLHDQEKVLEEVKIKSLSDIRKERKDKEKKPTIRRVRVADDYQEDVEIRKLEVRKKEKTSSKKHVSKHNEVEGAKLSVKARLGNGQGDRPSIKSRLNIGASAEDDVARPDKEDKDAGKKSASTRRRAIRMEIYRPPALKRKETTIEQERESEDIQNLETIPRKKSSEWGTKSFSEIMREKQLRKQQQEENKRNEESEPKKQTLTPITFESRSESLNIRNKFPRITFENKRVPAKEKSSRSDQDTTGSDKPARIVFDLDTEKKSAPSVSSKVKSVVLPLRKGLLSAVKKNSSSASSSITTVSNLVFNNTLKQALPSSSVVPDPCSSIPSLEDDLDDDLPVIEPPSQLPQTQEKQSSLTSDVSPRPPGSATRRSIRGSSGSNSDLKSTTEKRKSTSQGGSDLVDDILDDKLFEEELDDLLSDVKDMPVNTSHLADNDSLLQEMEELLA